MQPPSKTEAREMLARAAAEGDADSMLRAGAAALEAGAQADALEPVQALLQSHPKEARLWQLLGLLSRDMQDSALSLDAFRRAARLAPNDPMIADGLATVTFEAGLPAAELFERAIELNPDDRSLWLRLSAAWVQQGQAATIIGALDDELATDPGWIEGHKTLSKIRWEVGDREGFARSYERAVGAMPRSKELWMAYIQAVAYQPGGLDVIERARAAVGPQPEFDAAEAMVRSEAGQLEEAEPLFQRVAHRAGVSELIGYIRFLIRSGRVAEAAAIAQRNVLQGGNWLWPYLSVCWRLLDDPRWQWLEGDPQLIGVYDLEPKLPDLGKLAETLRGFHWASVEPVDQSLRGGTQTQGDLFSRIEPEIRELRKAIVAAVERYAAQLPPARPQHPTLIEQRSPIMFNGSWSVRLTGGGRHTDHLHPAGWLSSALYIALPDESERGDGEAGWLALGQASDLVPDLPPIRVVEPKPGRLVLFPSTMWHGTRPFGAGERLTVAFDVRRPG